MKILLICAFIAGIVLLGCSTINKAIGRPSPELVGVSAREDLGLDYKVHVDCTVLNKGATGDIDVFAELNMDGYWKKQQQVLVQSNETRTVTLTFSEPSFLGGGLSGGNYSCEF